MSAPLSDNISPLAPRQFLEPLLPRTQLALRLILALLVLVYAYHVPARLTLTPYLVFLIGVVVYIGIQSLLGLTTILNKAPPGILNAITVTDIIGSLAIVLNDPSPFPPSLILVVIALILAAAQHRQQMFIVVLASTVIATLITACIRQSLVNQPYHLIFFSLMLLLVASAPALFILSAHLERLRQRAARVTETDPLTGLGNRWTFYEAAKYLLPYHQRNLTPMVVMYADIEVTSHKGKKPAKTVNQYLLKQFASIVDQRLRASDIAVHYGGNEFAFLLVDTTTKDAETIAFDLQQHFNNWARQKELAAYAHIGMAVIPHRPIAMDQVLISINAALYRARQYKKGVSGAVFADPEQVR
jgi:diguanylate cyclase (GGDEF)-like protein